MDSFLDGSVQGSRTRRIAGLLAIAVVLASNDHFYAAAQSETTPAAAIPAAVVPLAQTAPEVSFHDEAATFKANVRLVIVRAVVRDRDGNAVGNLQKEDFQVFDNKKLQVINQFSIEQPGPLPALKNATIDRSTEQREAPAGARTTQSSSLPERYVAYYFDDAHLEFGNLAAVRAAAERHFTTLRPGDRAGVFTASGQTVLDFTDDRAKLREALLHLSPKRGIGDKDPCPDISYYEADLIVNKNDPNALKVGQQEFLTCYPSATYGPVQGLSEFIRSAARGVLSTGDRDSRLTLITLSELVKRTARMPGQRSVILISPGFLAPQMQNEYSDLIDHAIRAQVVVSALDARGVVALVPGGDASKKGVAIDPDPKENVLIDPGALESEYDDRASVEQAEVLSALAYGTGGTFFHDNNDFDEGFRRVAETPAYSYVLAFVPQSLKPDGSFHNLKVTLKNQERLNVQARLGYYAPKGVPDPAEQAKQELQEAIFSQEELQGVPIAVETQSFKSGDTAAKLTVFTHLDVHGLHFRMQDGHHDDELTVASALFDHNGNFIEGNQKTVTLKLKDESLEYLLTHGITTKAGFEVKPGSYLIRVVVRDGGGDLSAQNRAVEIPF
jgi:VWFA-related protein